MKTFLKVKYLTLTQEARIIKRLEKKRKVGPMRTSLHQHRTEDVRSEARSTHLARGFIKGTSYAEMELPLRPANQGHIATKNMTRSAPNWARIEQLIKKYGVSYFDSPEAMVQRFAQWRAEAEGISGDIAA